MLARIDVKGWVEKTEKGFIIPSERLQIVVDPFFQTLVNAVHMFYPLRHAFPIQLKSITVMNHMAEFPVWRQVGRQGFVKENGQ